MKYYPINIDIQNKPCLVVGGGRVAERKVKKLNEAGAAITVISKELTPALTELMQKSNVTFLDRHYQNNDVNGFFLVFAATNNPMVNQQICKEGKANSVLVNSLNGVDEGDFIIPALCTVGDLQLGVTTQGHSPALSARLRHYFQTQLSSLSLEQITKVATLRKEMLMANKQEKELKNKEMHAVIDEIIAMIDNEKININKL